MESEGGIASGNRTSMSWRTLAFASLTVAVVAIITAVIVLGLDRADALASIALALSILSFIVQLILYVLQSNTASQQLFQSQALNSETQKLLEEVRVRATSTQDLLSGQFNTLLEHALGRAADKAEAKTGISAAELEAIFRSSLARPVASDAARGISLSRAARQDRARRGSTSEDRAVLRELDRPVSEAEMKGGLDDLARLSLGARREFVRYVQDEFESRRNGGTVGFTGDLSPGEEELKVAGLIEEEARTLGPWYVLSGKGRALARVYAAADPGVRLQT